MTKIQLLAVTQQVCLSNYMTGVGPVSTLVTHSNGRAVHDTAGDAETVHCK